MLNDAASVSRSRYPPAALFRSAESGDRKENLGADAPQGRKSVKAAFSQQKLVELDDVARAHDDEHIAVPELAPEIRGNLAERRKI